MSVRVLSAVWDHSEAGGNARLVLLALADNADDTGLAWPSVALLARKCRIGERTVQRALRELVDIGELVVVSASKGGRTSTRYRVNLTPPGAAGAPSSTSPSGVKSSPRQSDTGDTGDTPAPSPVSPEPSLNRQETPNPVASATGDCRHGPKCRLRECGTNPRAVARRRQREAEDDERADRIAEANARIAYDEARRAERAAALAAIPPAELERLETEARKALGAEFVWVSAAMVETRVLELWRRAS